MQDKQKKMLISFVLLLIVGFLVFITTKTLAYLANDTKVEENSELIYYIDVTYDGIDQNSVVSSDSQTIELYSDIIEVYDKLPEGLTFTRFVGTPGSTIRAQSRNGNGTCGGTVVGGYNGLVYEHLTNTIYFEVDGLQAGCKISVGVVATTEKLSGKTRADYYNTAYAREKDFTAASGTVHAYIGDETATLRSVTYQYRGTIPSNASPLPSTNSYAPGNDVGVAIDGYAPGYTFSGWTADHATITDGKFTMPNQNVVLTGGFTENLSHTITYVISGDKPANYNPPSVKTYREGELVTIDKLTQDVQVGEYIFEGWTSPILSDLNFISQYDFYMPDSDIVFTGSFERKSYQLCYADLSPITVPYSTFPECEDYYAGDEVELPEPEEPTGYKFNGWDVDDPFIMPSEDYTIHGSYMYYNGSFRPTLTKTLNNPTGKSYFNSGDLVDFTITVTNTASYAIKEVMIRETAPCYFIDDNNSNIQIKTNTFALISTIASNGNATLHAQCVAGDDPVAVYVNTANLVGGLADNYYYLDLDTPIQATASYEVGNVTLHIISQNSTGGDLSSQTVFELYSNPGLTTSLGTGFTFEGLGAGTYYLKQKRAATGYQVLKNTLTVNVSSTGVVTIPSYTVTGSDGDYSVTIINDKISLLPNSGGPGNIYYVLFGLIVVIIGSAYYYVEKRKVYMR